MMTYRFSPTRGALALLPCLALACSDPVEGNPNPSASAGGSSGDPSSGGVASSGGDGNLPSGGMVGSGGTTTDPGSGGDMSGGGSGGGNQAGSGGSDPMGSGGGTMTDCSSLPVCDDFETEAAGGPPDAAVWVVSAMTGGTSVSITDEEAKSGTQSLKIVGPSSGQAYVSNISAFPPPASAIYFRTWVKYTDAAWDGHVTFIEAGATADPTSGGEVRIGGQNLFYHANLSDDGDGLSPDPFEWPTCESCVAPVADTWACLSGGFDPSANTVTLSVDGAVAVNASSADDWHSGGGTLPPSLARLSFGWESYGAGIANTIYFDDIAIGYAPLPCP